ncbi:acyl-CoA dehydrogenase family protein [Prauserella oleivorans]
MAILDSPREAWERGRNLAGEPRDTLLLQDTFVPGEDVTEVDATISGRAFRVRGALGRALLLSGAMEAALDSTITYAGQREQFGRPISRFQAVSHHLAAMAEEAAASTTVAMSAATAGQQPDWILTAAAKAQAGRAAGVVARLAHQVHGALGFTDEHPLRLITTRLWSWRDEFGNERFWERELGAAACAAPDLWTLVTDPAEVRANG